MDSNYLLETIKVEYEDKSQGVLSEGDYKLLKAIKKDCPKIMAAQEKLDKEALEELKRLEKEK